MFWTRTVILTVSTRPFRLSIHKQAAHFPADKHIRKAPIVSKSNLLLEELIEKI